MSVCACECVCVRVCVGQCSVGSFIGVHQSLQLTSTPGMCLWGKCPYKVAQGTCQRLHVVTLVGQCLVLGIWHIRLSHISAHISAGRFSTSPMGECHFRCALKLLSVMLPWCYSWDSTLYSQMSGFPLLGIHTVRIPPF